MTSRIHIFQRYGIELEYMIVDKDTLKIRPITDELFKQITGEYCNDIEQGPVTWSNELVLHVLEIKCTNPEANLVQLAADFDKNVQMVNEKLAPFNAKLLPTAAHPLMDPNTETFLWPHDNNEVYAAYNRIFNCKGHGWSNLQSTHLNLPFYDDEEFAVLHAAIRLILPILPAMSASSPILSAKETGFLDKRLDYYQKNQRILPALTGKVIPERAFSKRQYTKMIYDRIKHSIAPHDPEEILNPIWLNSRGAIARFDRGSIEIRVLDIQECPKADLAILSLIIGVLKVLVSGKLVDFHTQQLWEVDPLNSIFQETILKGENAMIVDKDYLGLFGIKQPSITAGELWQHLYTLVEKEEGATISQWKEQLDVIFQHGTLATRILKSLGGIYSEQNIKMIYSELADCLAKNEMYKP